MIPDNEHMFLLFPHETDRFHTVFHLREDEEHFLWSAHIEFHAIDLSQFMVQWKKYRREMKKSAEVPWLMCYRWQTFEKSVG
ncbi:hypothetical protein P9755_05015 [Parageobacillus toebii]|nr:hypothetical protein [Parageobacillus toebii]